MDAIRPLAKKCFALVTKKLGTRWFPVQSWLDRFQNKQIRSRLHTSMPHETQAGKSEQGSNQKPQPVAVCTRCGALSYSLEMINGQCSQVTAGKRCTGVIGSAANKKTLAGAASNCTGNQNALEFVQIN